MPAFAVFSRSLGHLVFNAGVLAAALGQAQQWPQVPDFGPPAPVKIDPLMTRANTASLIGTVTTGGNSHTGGNAWVDYNGDYLPDLLVTNGAGLQHYLFRNEGDGTFTNVSSLVAKPNINLESAGVACADLDNDGDTDILVAVDSATHVNIQTFNPTAGGPNLLYENQGNGTFVQDAAGWGVVDSRGWRNITVNLADIDNDGLVDAYLGCWAINNGPYNRYNTMYRNTGSAFSVFAAGTEAHGQDTLTALFFDADMDLDPDLFVGNASPFHNPPLLDCTDQFYRCGSGGAYTEEVFTGVGLDACADMGLDVGDIDNDGDWDLYCTDFYTASGVPDGNFLYLGAPDGSLSPDISKTAGVQADDSWPCNFVDLDLDGWVDLWVGNARDGRADFIYMNNRDLTFDDRTPASWQAGGETKGGSMADYDADGDVDIFMWNDAKAGGGQQTANSYLYRNDTRTPHNWIQFKLLGVTSNRDAIGATVYVTSGGLTQMRRVSGGDSAHSQQEQILSFGVARLYAVDVEVRWPSGIVQNFSDVSTNAFHVIDELGGLADEALLEASAVYDPATGTYTVSARSSYGGRTKLAVDGLGALDYDASKTRFSGVFPADGPLPTALHVRSQRGASCEAPLRFRSAR